MRSKQSFGRYAVSVPPVKKTRRAFMFVLACLVWLNIIPTASGFISLQQERLGLRRNIMIDKVHKDHWVIHYNYGDDCPVERRNNDEALTVAVTEVLQMWLQPLREYTDRPIVNDFRYKLNADWDAADFGITFHCDIRGGSHAHVLPDETPGITMHGGIQVNKPFMMLLLHEMGHIFGLADTYIPAKDWGKPGLSKGGLDSTKGTQPASLMSGHLTGKDKKRGLGTDDKNGIVYLYKVSYEGLSIFDCFFPDYERENPPLGCVPKRLLIFALKNGPEIHALRMLKEDEHLDLNARDADGMTALHHAILNAYTEVVESLLAHPKIRVNIRSNDGRTPAQLARDMGRFQLTKRIWEHPTSKLPPWSVIPKGKLATTWGHLKKQY